MGCVAAPLTIKVNGAASTNGSGKHVEVTESENIGRCVRVTGPAFVPHVDSLARPLTLALMICDSTQEPPKAPHRSVTRDPEAASAVKSQSDVKRRPRPA